MDTSRTISHDDREQYNLQGDMAYNYIPLELHRGGIAKQYAAGLLSSHNAALILPPGGDASGRFAKMIHLVKMQAFGFPTLNLLARKRVYYEMLFYRVRGPQQTGRECLCLDDVDTGEDGHGTPIVVQEAYVNFDGKGELNGDRPLVNRAVQVLVSDPSSPEGIHQAKRFDLLAKYGPQFHEHEDRSRLFLELLGCPVIQTWTMDVMASWDDQPPLVSVEQVVVVAFALRSLVIAYGERLDMSGHRLNHAFTCITLALALQLDPSEDHQPLFKRTDRVQPDAIAKKVPWFQATPGATASDRWVTQGINVLYCHVINKAEYRPKF